MKIPWKHLILLLKRLQWRLNGLQPCDMHDFSVKSRRIQLIELMILISLWQLYYFQCTVCGKQLSGLFYTLGENIVCEQDYKVTYVLA